MGTKNHARAVRYRELALAETDSAKADLLCLLAEEAERDAYACICKGGFIRTWSSLAAHVRVFPQQPYLRVATGVHHKCSMP